MIPSFDGPGAAELALLGWAHYPITLAPHPPPRFGLPPAQWAARMAISGWELVGVGATPTLAVVNLGIQLRRWLGTHPADRAAVQLRAPERGEA